MPAFRRWIVRVVILWAAALLLAALLIPRLASFAATSVTLTPDADSYVHATYPDNNYGTSTQLRVDGSPDVRSFLRFTVSGLNGQTISQAILQIYANTSGSAGLTAMTVADNSWDETTITYNNMPPMGSTISSSGAVTGGTWSSLDVTSYITGEGTYSIGVITPGSTAISLASRQSGANSPRLVLTLGGGASVTDTPSGPAATPTDTPGGSIATPTDTPSAPAATPTDTPSGPANTPTSTASAPSPTPTDTAAAPTPTPTVVSASGTIKHVFMILMENKGYNQVWNVSNAPYIASLGNAYARATNFYAITHPSLPNYLDLYAGDNYGITNDCSPSSSCHVGARNLADNLDAAGLTWKGYMESMPSPCYLTVSGNYAPKHDPFVYMDDIRTDKVRCDSHVVNFDALSGDLAAAGTTPNYAFITPDLCSDMHNCSIKTGDTWLANHVPAILDSPACTSDKCLVVLTWDEDNGQYGNHILTIFAGSGAKTGGVASGTRYTLFSLLRTVEEIFGLPTQTGNDGSASAMTDMLR